MQNLQMADTVRLADDDVDLRRDRPLMRALELERNAANRLDAQIASTIVPRSAAPDLDKVEFPEWPRIHHGPRDRAGGGREQPSRGERSIEPGAEHPVRAR